MKKAIFSAVMFFVLLFFGDTTALDARGAQLFDASSQKEARSLAREGRLQEALDKFQSMLNVNEKEIWTAQALLVCDEKDIEQRIVDLESITKEPVILIRRVVDSKTCIRVCAGLFRSRQEAAAMGQQLPSPFKEAKPYPLLLVSNAAYAKGAFDLAVPPQASAGADAHPPVVEPANAPPAGSGRDEKAIPVSDAAGVDTAQDLFNKGINSFNRNDLAEAESFFKRSIALAPDRFEAYNNLGAVLLNQKKYSEAREILEKAVQLQPGYPNAHSNLGGAYWFLGMRQEAISEAQKAFRLDSHNVRYCTNLASFLYEEKRYSDAQIYLNVVKIIDPANEDALALQKRVDEALGKKNDSQVAVVDEVPADRGQGAENQEKTENKKKDKNHEEESVKDDEAAAPDTGDKPKKKFWDRFKKQGSKNDSSGTDDQDAGSGEKRE